MAIIQSITTTVNTKLFLAATWLERTGKCRRLLKKSATHLGVFSDRKCSCCYAMRLGPFDAWQYPLPRCASRRNRSKVASAHVLSVGQALTFKFCKFLLTLRSKKSAAINNSTGTEPPNVATVAIEQEEKQRLNVAKRAKSPLSARRRLLARKNSAIADFSHHISGNIICHDDQFLFFESR